MFTIVQNYKKMFLLFIKNEFVFESSSNPIQQDSNNNGLIIDDLIDSALSDDKIDKKELLKIQDKYEDKKEEIGKETQSKIDKFMKDMYTEMLKDGINIKNLTELEDLLSRFDKVGIDVGEDVKKTWRIEVARTINGKSSIYKLKEISGTFVNGKFEDKIDWYGINNDYISSGELESKGYKKGFLDLAINNDNKEIKKEKEKEEEKEKQILIAEITKICEEINRLMESDMVGANEDYFKKQTNTQLKEIKLDIINVLKFAKNYRNESQKREEFKIYFEENKYNLSDSDKKIISKILEDYGEMDVYDHLDAMEEDNKKLEKYKEINENKKRVENLYEKEAIMLEEKEGLVSDIMEIENEINEIRLDLGWDETVFNFDFSEHTNEELKDIKSKTLDTFNLYEDYVKEFKKKEEFKIYFEENEKYIPSEDRKRIAELLVDYKEENDVSYLEKKVKENNGELQAYKNYIKDIKRLESLSRKTKTEPSYKQKGPEYSSKGKGPIISDKEFTLESEPISAENLIKKLKGLNLKDSESISNELTDEDISFFMKSKNDNVFLNMSNNFANEINVLLSEEVENIKKEDIAKLRNLLSKYLKLEEQKTEGDKKEEKSAETKIAESLVGASEKLLKSIENKEMRNLSTKDGVVTLNYTATNGTKFSSYFSTSEHPELIESKEALMIRKNKKIKTFEERVAKKSVEPKKIKKHGKEKLLSIKNDKVKKKIDGIVGIETLSKSNEKQNINNIEDHKPKINDNTDFVGDKTEVASSSLEKIAQWIKELFKDQKDIGYFTGRNGEKVIVEFDKDNNKLSFDTPYFDNVFDFDIANVPEGINSKPAALNYIKEQISSVKEQYDNKVIANAIKDVTKSEKPESTVISTVKVEGIDEPLNIRLGSSFTNSQTDGVYIKVDTTYSDGISDGQVTEKIMGKVTEDKINIAVQNVERKYKELYALEQAKKLNEK